MGYNLEGNKEVLTYVVDTGKEIETRGYTFQPAHALHEVL